MLRLALLSGLIVAGVAFAQQQSPQELADIAGTIVASSGEPLPGAAVTLTRFSPPAAEMIPGKAYPARPPAFIQRATSDKAGSFSFKGLESGPYIIRATHDGYSPGAYGAASPGSPAMALKVAAGARIDNLHITLALKFETTLTGTILDDSGGGMPGVMVQLVRATRPMGRVTFSIRATVWTGSGGEFTIGDKNVPPGRYYLAASRMRWNGQSREPKVDYVTTWYPGVTELSSASPIDLGTVGGIQKIDLRMAKGAVYYVRGRVTGKIPGVAMGETHVVLTSARDSPNPSPLLGMSTFVHANVENDGSFRLALPGPGAYYLTASGAGQTLSLGCERIQVDNGDLNGVTIAYQPHRELRGKVRIESAASGMPANLPPMRISLVSNEIITNANSAVATVNSDGSFVFPDLAPGAYQVQVLRMPAGLYLRSVLAGSHEVGDAGFEFLSRADSEPLTIALSGDGGYITGSVTPPAAGGRVSVTPERLPGSEAQYRSATVDETGHFRLSALPPGRYRVYAWKNADLRMLMDFDFLKAFLNNSVSVDVGPGAPGIVTLTQISATESH